MSYYTKNTRGDVSLTRIHKSTNSSLLLVVGLLLMSLNIIDAAPAAIDFAKMFGLVYNTKYTGANLDT
jgi:hypothetical protein